jgi:homoserine kinase
MKKVKITVPATSANIGAGFDSMGLAVSLYNTVEMEESENLAIVSADGQKKSHREDHLIYQTAKEISRLRKEAKGLYHPAGKQYTLYKRPRHSSPVSSRRLRRKRALGSPLAPKGYHRSCGGLGRESGNSTPAFWAGMLVAAMENTKGAFVKNSRADKISFGAFIPDFELSTEKARSVLPAMVTRQDAVFNLSHAALTAVSLMSGNLHNIEIAVGDRLHQPYRLGLIENAGDIFALARSAGAYGTYISGAGPTLMAIVDKNDNGFFEKADGALRENFPRWKILMLRCEENGTKWKKLTLRYSTMTIKGI